MTSLSARLLVLTIIFVMLAEVFIYVPSIARFRLAYLEERIAASHIATLALEAAPDHMISEELQTRLLAQAEVLAVVLKRAESRRLVLGSAMPPEVDGVYDLSIGPTPDSRPFTLIADAFDTLDAEPGRTIRGPPEQDRLRHLRLKLFEIGGPQQADGIALVDAHDQPVAGNGEIARLVLRHRPGEFLLAAMLGLAVERVVGEGHEAARLAMGGVGFEE